MPPKITRASKRKPESTVSEMEQKIRGSAASGSDSRSSSHTKTEDEDYDIEDSINDLSLKDILTAESREQIERVSNNYSIKWKYLQKDSLGCWDIIHHSERLIQRLHGWYRK